MARLRGALRIGAAGLLLALALPACGDDGAVGTRIDVIEPPPASAAAGQPIAVGFRVVTDGELHVALVGACQGEAVPDCGADTFDEIGYADFEGFESGDELAGAVTLEAEGPWTVFAYVHVDEDGHLSEPFAVDVTP